MERRREVGLDSYDRFFPSQDTLPKGGFGNLIAIPLQKSRRENGNSVFVDRNLKSFADQWAYLSTVKRISRQQVERIVWDVEQAGDVVGIPRSLTLDEALEDPWTLPPSGWKSNSLKDMKRFDHSRRNPYATMHILLLRISAVELSRVLRPRR
jgi:hypothetical protein